MIACSQSVGRAEDTAAPTEAPAIPESAQAPASAKPRVQVNALLNGTRWTIQLRPMFAPPSSAVLHDTLIFQEGNVTSERLAARGFLPSAFTLTIGENHAPEWEAMQRSAQDGIAYWRGELREDVIQGIIDIYPLNGETQNYTFTSRGDALESKGTDRVIVPLEPSVVPAAQATPAATKPVRKRRWWF